MVEDAPGVSEDQSWNAGVLARAGDHDITESSRQTEELAGSVATVTVINEYSETS